MQSACNQLAISLQSVYNQHAIRGSPTCPYWSTRSVTISMQSEALPPARIGAPDHRNASRAARRTATWPRHGRRRGHRRLKNGRRRGRRGLWNERRRKLLLLLLLMIRRCRDSVRDLHRGDLYWVHEGSRCRRQRRRRGAEGRARTRARARAELGLEIELISAHELARFSRSVIEKPLEIRPLLELALPDAIRRSQRHHSRQSEVIRGHQRPSNVIRGHQRSSEVIRGHQRSSEVIRVHQRSSEVVRGHQRPSDVIRGHQRPLVVIRGHQRSSEVIRGSYLPVCECRERSHDQKGAAHMLMHAQVVEESERLRGLPQAHLVR